MKKVILNNGLKLIYKKKKGNLTSFTIGFEAGANLDWKDKYGLAHVVEHMVYKGTTKYSEEDINKIIDKIFGFSNAMTNYPYVIYYGTCLCEDFQEGLKLHSDILQRPLFSNKGFQEELNVIYEELKEWREDLYQHCEDLCFKNAFSNRRIKEIIIGSEESLSNITLEDLKKFHKNYYTANNCVISVVSSLEFSKVLSIVKSEFQHMNVNYNLNNSYILNKKEDIYEKNNNGIYEEYEENVGDKIYFMFPIDHLSEREVQILEVFNVIFGEGVSSLLYSEIRTKWALAYEVGSKVKKEKGIKIFKIYLGTSKDKSSEAMKIIKDLIDRAKNDISLFNEDIISNAIKMLRLKKSISLEKSIVESVKLCTSEIMFGNHVDENNILPVYKEFDGLDEITDENIINTINKVFKNGTVQVLH